VRQNISQERRRRGWGGLGWRQRRSRARTWRSGGPHWAVFSSGVTGRAAEELPGRRPPRHRATLVIHRL